MVVLGLVMSMACVTETAPAAQRGMFLVAEEPPTADASLFERTIVSSVWGRGELSIARTPSLEIALEEIAAATVERRRSGEPLPPAVLEELKKEGVVVGPSSSSFTYLRLTLNFRPDAAKVLHQFTSANVRRSVDIRLDGRRLAVGMILEPVGEAVTCILG